MGVVMHTSHIKHNPVPAHNTTECYCWIVSIETCRESVTCILKNNHQILIVMKLKIKSIFYNNLALSLAQLR